MKRLPYNEASFEPKRKMCRKTNRKKERKRTMALRSTEGGELREKICRKTKKQTVREKKENKWRKTKRGR